MGETINIMEYLEIFKKRKKVVFVILFIFLLTGGLLQYKHSKSYVPTYSSTVSVRINTNKSAQSQEPTAEESTEGQQDPAAENQTEENQAAENTAQQNAQNNMRSSLEASALNQSIAEKYSSVAVSKRAMMELIEKLGLESTPEMMASKISVVPQENLMEFIDIKVTDTNPELARNIASTMPEVFNDEIGRVIGLDCVEVLYDATEPMMNPKPADNTFRNFALIGIVLAIFVVLLLECLDNKVVTPDDAEKYWELPVIGIVPLEKEKTKGKRLGKVNKESKDSTVNDRNKKNQIGEVSQINQLNKDVKLNMESIRG